MRGGYEIAGSSLPSVMWCSQSRCPPQRRQQYIGVQSSRTLHVACAKTKAGRGGRGKEFIAFPVRSSPAPAPSDAAKQLPAADEESPAARMTAWWNESWWAAENVEALKILAKMPWADVDVYNDM